MVQWLRICLSIQGMWFQSLVMELRSHMPHGVTLPPHPTPPKKRRVHFRESLGRPMVRTSHSHCGASLVAQIVKNLPAMWKTQVQSLGWEDPGEGKSVRDLPPPQNEARAPCAIQEVLVSYQFSIQYCVYVSCFLCFGSLFAVLHSLWNQLPDQGLNPSPPQ